MTIGVGSKVPDVRAEAYVRGAHEPWRIELPGDGDHWTVLVFYPRDFTFVCPTELAALAELHDEFGAADAAVVAASTDSYWSHKAWFETAPLLAAVRYPVIADTSHRLANAFGVLGPDGAALRGTFVIDPTATIRHASVTDLNVGRSPAETLRVVHALQTGELCPVDWRPGAPTLRIAA
jgi:alkyl hydroperoxide reductase subunit AhpC